MKPKSRKEILETCQNNFLEYSTLSKIMIIIAIVLSAAAVVYYIGGYVMPTVQGIMNGDIVGWNVLWKVFLGYLLYYILKIANLICAAIGGSAMCREENWDSLDFAKAWVDIYKYEDYLDEINDTTDSEKSE